MKAFSQLLDRLTYTPARNGKLMLMYSYKKVKPKDRIKDATGKIERVSQQRAACGKDFIQLSGEDATIIDHRLHVAIQECEQQTTNVCAVNVRI